MVVAAGQVWQAGADSGVCGEKRVLLLKRKRKRKSADDICHNVWKCRAVGIAAGGHVRKEKE